VLISTEDASETADVNREKSRQAFDAARRVIPGGVNSPVRAFKGVGGGPVFVKSATGCRITDVDGNSYIDYVSSWGPLILGHGHPAVVDAVRKAVCDGSSFGAPTLAETRLAEMIVDAVPSIDKVRMVNSGTEATMSAIRLARGFTGRDLVVKFDGCYHGHGDALLVTAGSGPTTFGMPSSPGIPDSFTSKTLSLPYNDLEAVGGCFTKFGDDIACVIVEPIAGNMGVIPPAEGFLKELRKLADKHGSLLIFDEVITGFRVAYGGAQEYYGITPDLTTLGKIIGGGMPVGAYGGRAEIMDRLSPDGDVYQAGTLSGNPVAVAAGIATLEQLHDKTIYDRLEQFGGRLGEGLPAAAREAGIAAQANRVGSMMSIFFTDEPVTDMNSALKSDSEMYSKFFWGMLERGHSFAPSRVEATFVSAAHTAADIDSTLAAARDVFATIQID